MEKTVHYLETHSQNPYYNLAFEEYVLCHRTEGDYLLLWQNDNTIVVGRNQNTEAEINRAFVEEHHINVVRRGTGGGAVYHDLGNLNYSFITDVGDDGISIRRFTQPVVAALRSLGLNAEASGRNDILVEGRKVSGTAQRRHAGRILHHGTLLFDANPGMVAGALNVDPEKFRSKSTKSVRARIGNIRDFLPDALTADELAAVECLKTEKYDTWAWNYGRSPKFDVTRKRYWDGGCLEASVSIADGRITDIRFCGDFLAVRDMDALLAALKGTAYRPEAVRPVLEASPVAELFGAITADEVIVTLFDL